MSAKVLGLIDPDKIDAAVLDLNLDFGGTVFPIAGRLGESGVPHMFATGDVQLSRGSGYADRPRLEKPFARPESVHAVAAVSSSTRR